LGSSTFLTDANGVAYQFFLNLPFGETMAEQKPSSYYATPYKFNGKELDEETGLYYYGARYYDPKMSLWMSTDPLAEKFPNVNPYVYCLNNPINMIDPDGRDPVGPPKKNIYIVLDYNGRKAGDEKRETIKFVGMESKGWHGIYASNIQDANDKLLNYLGAGQADNILLEGHGSIIERADTNGNPLPVGSFMKSDNNTDSKIRDSDLGNSVLGNNNTNQADVMSLVGIINKVNSGGNFYLQTCNTADSDAFFNNLSTLTGDKVNLFGSTGLCGPATYTPDGSTEAIYSPVYLFDRNTSYGFIKQFQAGCSGEKPIIHNGIEINKNGIKHY
jgi:RHS repeat-associated protein